jgi:uncharacterized protein
MRKRLSNHGWSVEELVGLLDNVAESRQRPLLAREGLMKSYKYILGAVLALVFLGSAYFAASRFLRRSPVKQLVRRAESGDAKAAFQLGQLYFRGGENIGKNPAEAAKWYRRAAEAGLSKAQNNIGVMYSKGEGVTKDEAVAVEWLTKAALQSNQAAERNLGRHYLDGNGIPQNYVESARWFRKAAEQGDASSQRLLGALYLRGMGVQRDIVVGYAWLLLAKASGDTPSRDSLDAIGKQLSTRQVHEAQQFASDWWASRNKGGSSMAEHSKTGQAVSHKGAESALSKTDLLTGPRNSPAPKAHTYSSASNDCETGHWIESVSNDGSIVRLEDGSTWKVSEIDTVDSSLWLPIEDIVICEGKLINTDDNESVEAHRLR